MEKEALYDVRAFGIFADDDILRWQLLKGCLVKHKTFGWGEVKNISRGPSNSGIYLEVEFKSATEGKKLRTFGGSSFNDGLFVTIDYDLPSIPGFIGFKDKILDDIKRQAILAELQAEKRKKEEKRKEKEKELLKELNIFNKKYTIRRASFTEFNLPLYEIILKMESGKALTKKDIAWLEDHKFFPLLVYYYRWAFSKTNSLWDLVKAAGFLRKGGDPSKAHELLQDKKTEDKQLMAAIYTCAAAALNDIGNIEKAMEIIKKAIEVDPQSYYAYNTLGRICYQSDLPEDGFGAFQRAIELGASPGLVEEEIKRYSSESRKK